MNAVTAAVKASSAVPVRRIRTVEVPPGQINLLTQVRDLYDDENLQALADNIVELGLLELPGAAELTLTQVRGFLRQHNRAWGTAHNVATMVPGIDKYYVIGCFGHRRILAHVLLWERGCTSCRDTYGEEAPGTCWARHPETLNPDGTMEIRLTRNPSWLEAMLRQAAENAYVPPPPVREAQLWEQIWLVMKAATPKLTLKQFAMKVGRPAAMVSERLRFQQLPEEVRKWVSAGKIKWGIAIELLRLQAQGFDDKQLVYWMVYAFTKRLTVAKFHETISKLNDPAARDVTMFFFAEESAREQVLDEAIRDIPLATLAMQHRALFDQLDAVRAGILGDRAAALQHPKVLEALDTARQAHAAIEAVSRPVGSRRRRAAANSPLVEMVG